MFSSVLRPKRRPRANKAAIARKNRLLGLPARLPELHRGHRHIEVRAGPARKSVGDGVHHGRDRCRGAGFADTFDAERIGGRAHIVHGVADVGRHVGGARHRIVLERAGHELAGIVVENLLHQRLA
jgi:hypothetical protein